MLHYTDRQDKIYILTLDDILAIDVCDRLSAEPRLKHVEIILPGTNGDKINVENIAAIAQDTLTARLLILDVRPKPGMHLYAAGDHSYEAIDLRMAETPGADLKEGSYPAAEIMHLPAIKETVPVYDEPLRIVRDLRVDPRGE